MKVVVLTGAGISAESGVPTFRDSDGLWEGHRAEDVATPEAFEYQPAVVQRFYDARRAALAGVEPNPAHLALARLEEALGDDLLVVTQNVDDLHERAGSTRVVHMHGELLSALCVGCRAPLALGRRPQRPPAVPALRQRRAAPRHRLVRRDPLRDGPHRRGARSNATCSSRSAPRARSTPRPASCRTPPPTAPAPSSSTCCPARAATCSTSPASAPPAYSSRTGSPSSSPPPADPPPRSPSRPLWLRESGQMARRVGPCGGAGLDSTGQKSGLDWSQLSTRASEVSIQPVSRGAPRRGAGG